MIKYFLMQTRVFIKRRVVMELFREHMDIAVVREYPTLTLAHIGDCVYELLARSHVVRSGIFKVSDTHM